MSKKKVDIISLDNKVVSNEVKKEEVKVNKNFVEIKQTKLKKEILLKNGRVYKKIDNQYGMYLDDGKVFKL